MNQYEMKLSGAVKSTEFILREDNTLAVKLGLAKGPRTLVFHDFLKKGKRRYCLFNPKTVITEECGATVVRAAAMDPEDGAPIPGLLVTYRFTFDEKLAAFYLSASYGSDMRLDGYTVKLMEVTWEDITAESFTGYEYDAEGKPFSHTFKIPEKNPLAPDYEELLRITPHTAWERMKTRPHSFKKAVAIEGKDGYLAVYGGTPMFHVEAEYIAAFPGLAEYDGDLRWFSGKNAPGAWFILEKPEDLFPVMEELDGRVPENAEHVFAPFAEKTVTLQAGSFQSTLLQSRGGIWVTAEESQPWPLFHICLWDTKYERELRTDSGTSWSRVDVLERENFARFTLSDPEGGRVSGVSVVAEAFMEPKKQKISWKMRIVNLSDRWSVTSVSYPQCLVRGCETGYVSIGSGVLMQEFNRRSTVFRAKYPLGVKTNMPIAALYDPKKGGVYMGVHDPNGNPRFLSMVGGGQSGCSLFSAWCELPYARRAGNSFTLPGEMVWQGFEGDWFDAVKIYKEFVHAQATWLPKLRGRPDTPRWMREMPVWIMHFMPNENPDANPFPITLREKYPDKNPEDWYATAVRFREEIGVPVAYHLYNWHWVPFNNDNPHYFPVHHDLKEGMLELKKADIRVVPYMAGYSWDMHDCRGDDYRFQQEALPATAKDVSGAPISKSYAATEPNGNIVKFARMCPSTAFWKNEVRQVVRKLYTDYGMDGIYLDVVSAQYEQCCDDSHLHSPGYGDFWWKAYAELIAGLRVDAPEDFVVLSESVAEVHSGALDGYLAWTWVQPEQVPGYPAVYGGRVAVFGRVSTLNKRDDDAYFRFQLAQSFAFGQQLGWIHPEIVDDEKQFPFLKKLAQLRWKYRQFFAEAEMLRPPHVEGKMELLNCEAFLRGQFWNHEKSVVAAGWEDAAGKRSLFVINSGAEAAEVTLTVAEAEYALPESLAAFTEETGAELLKVEREGGVCRLHCRISPEGYGVLNW